MKNECNIIRDLLPLYAEKIASDDSVSFVEAHLKKCSACRAVLDEMKKPVSFQFASEAAPIRKLKKKLAAKRLQTIIFTAVLAIAIVVSAFAAVDAPRFFTYTEDLLTLTEHEDGSVTITFREDVTDYNCSRVLEPDTGTYRYSIEAWDSVWDHWFAERDKQATTIQPTDHKGFTIYYMQNNGSEDVRLYGKAAVTFDSVISLPRLALGYYLILAIAAFFALLLAWFFLRKKPTARKWIERLLLIPVSYGIGHLLVCGFDAVTYAIQRDFAFILFVSLLIYCGLLLAHNIYRSRKELKAAETQNSSK